MSYFGITDEKLLYKYVFHYPTTGRDWNRKDDRVFCIYQNYLSMGQLLHAASPRVTCPQLLAICCEFVN